MYESVTTPKPRRDRMMLVLILAAVVLIAAVTPPIFIALNASYRYHNFVLDFSNDLVDARSHGTITFTENGESCSVSPDAVSTMFVRVTDYGLGQPLKEPPNAPCFTVSLPNGTVLTLYDTPQEPPEDSEDDLPRGTTIYYAPAEGKPFIYLQRQLLFEDAVRPLHAGR